MYNIEAIPLSVIEWLKLISTYYIYLARISPSVISLAIAALLIAFLKFNSESVFIFVIKLPHALAALVYESNAQYSNSSVWSVSKNLLNGENTQSVVSAYAAVLLIFAQRIYYN